MINKCKQYFFLSYIKKNNIEKITQLLKDPDFDPIAEDNKAIVKAYDYSSYEVVNLLFKNERIQNSLKKYNIYLYHQILNDDFYMSINSENLDRLDYLLKNFDFDPSNTYLPIYKSILNERFKSFKILLKDSRFNLAEDNNSSIRHAYQQKIYYEKNYNEKYITIYNDIINSLWESKIVKYSLKNDDSELYEMLINEKIISNIKSF